jgi:hypothetical protein
MAQQSYRFLISRIHSKHTNEEVLKILRHINLGTIKSVKLGKKKNYQRYCYVEISDLSATGYQIQFNQLFSSYNRFENFYGGLLYVSKFTEEFPSKKKKPIDAETYFKDIKYRLYLTSSEAEIW